MSAAERIEPFDKQHDVRGFDCGQPSLDRWLVQYASQGERRNTARTHVAVAHDGAVVGYYSIVASEIKQTEATAAVKRGTSPHFPIPACLITRLAVDRRHQGHKVGAKLLLDAARRVVLVGQHVGIRAIAVSAIDANAASFYRHFAFDPIDVDQRKLMVALATIETIAGPAR